MLQYFSRKNAFTLTELIVVITILAILGSIGFVSLTNFNTRSRDSKRLTDVRMVQAGLSVQQSAGIILPIPDSSTNILSSGSLITLQGYVGTGVVGSIRMSSPPPIDPSTSGPSILYTTNEKRTHFQLVTFFEEQLASSHQGIPFVDSAYAAGAYEKRIVKSFGSELGTILKSDNSPVSGTSYDIILNTSEPLKIVLSDTSSVTGTGSTFSAINPRGSCKRIFESGEGKKDGTYTLLVGGAEVPVYCSMTYLDKNFYEHIIDGDFENPNGTNWQSSLKIPLVSKGNSIGLNAVGEVQINSNDYTYVDTSKKYSLSGKFRSAGAALSRLHFGFIEYDSNFVPIDDASILATPGTETILTKAVNSTDTVVEFVNNGTTCSAWQNTPYFAQYATIAFDVDDSRSFNDLPNRKRSSRGFVSIVNNGPTCTLTLSLPVGLSYPIGTKIRSHYAGSTYNYVAAAGETIPNIWTSYTGTIQGESLKGNDYFSFRRGTKFIRVFVLANHPGINGILEMDDFKLEVVK